MPTTGPDSPKGPASTGGLLDLYDSLCIPHFQRGLVWDEGSVALLLESLYDETPCGTILLWSPDDPAEHGVPLGAKPRHLVVDGQQRVRSLYGVFRGGNESLPDSGNGDAQDKHAVWCLNLGRVPELADRFRGGRRFRLFRLADLRLTDKKAQGAVLHDREALLPLKAFLDGDKEVLTRTSADAVRGCPEVRRRLEGMRERELFHILPLPGQRTFAEVVAIYNRINSAGRRVEAEEIAFASLVAVHPEAGGALVDVLSQAEGKEGPAARPPRAGVAPLDRDPLLRREKESRFGFKLFMRTFAMALAYHTRRKIGSSSFSFDAVNAEGLEKARGHLGGILGETRSILAGVARMLRERLHCDDFRMLPDASSLWPLFQLLLRFPVLLDRSQDALASVALRLLLADLDTAALLEFVEQVDRAHTVEAALGCLEREPLDTPGIHRALEDKIGKVDSLQNRYTMMLYWLLRAREARDFRYDRNVRERAPALAAMYGESEPLLDERLKPEKQHIVPYGRLKDVFDLEGRARPGRHEVNDIANVTYISAGLNGYDTGVGSTPLALREEHEKNLRAHLLPGHLLGLYEEACAWAEKKGDDGARQRAKEKYAAFCEGRRKEIVVAFQEWEEKISAKGRKDVIPSSWARPRLASREDAAVHDLGFPTQVTSALVALRAVKGMNDAEKKGSTVCWGFKTKRDGKVKQTLRIDLYDDKRRIVLNLSDAALLDWLKASFGALRFVKEGKCELGADDPSTSDVLWRLAERLRGRAKA